MMNDKEASDRDEDDEGQEEVTKTVYPMRKSCAKRTDHKVLYNNEENNTISI
jgi:hypothetical protein